MYKGNCKLQTAKKDTLIEKNQEKGVKNGCGDYELKKSTIN